MWSQSEAAPILGARNVSWRCQRIMTPISSPNPLPARASQCQLVLSRDLPPPRSLRFHEHNGRLADIAILEGLWMFWGPFDLAWLSEHGMMGHQHRMRVDGCIVWVSVLVIALHYSPPAGPKANIRSNCVAYQVLESFEDNSIPESQPALARLTAQSRNLSQNTCTQEVRARVPIDLRRKWDICLMRHITHHYLKNWVPCFLCSGNWAQVNYTIKFCIVQWLEYAIEKWPNRNLDISRYLDILHLDKGYLNISISIIFFRLYSEVIGG